MGIRNVYTPDELFQFYERLANYFSEMPNVDQPLDYYIMQYFQRFSFLEPSQIPLKEIKNFLLKFFPQKLSHFTTKSVEHPSLDPVVKMEGCSMDLTNNHVSSSSAAVVTNSTATAPSKLEVSTFCYNYFFTASSAAENVAYVSPVKMDRRTAVYKRSYRASNAQHEYIEIDCSEAALPARFDIIVKDIFRKRKSCTECYDLILNTLAKYYSRRTWSTNTQNCVAGFLCQYFVKNSGEICAEVLELDKLREMDFDDIPGVLDEDDMTLTRLQVNCMVELFCSRVYFRTIDELYVLDTLKHMKFIYSEADVRKFITECLIRRFGELVPDKVEAICAEFGVPMVLPKNKSSNAESRTPSRRSRSPVKGRRKRISSSDTKLLEDLEEGDDDDDNSLESYSNDVILRDRIFGDMIDLTMVPSTSSRFRSKKVTSEFAVDEPSTSSRCFTNQGDKPSNSNLLKKDYVPCYRRIDSSSEDEKVCDVKDVPKTRTPRSPVKQMPIKKRQNQKSKPKSDAEAPKRKAIAIPITTSAAPPPSSKKSEKAVKLAPIFSRRNSIANFGTNSPSMEANNAASILSDNTINQYKKKMEAIRSNARSLKNNQEIFYGRSNSRKGLFEEDEEDSTKLTREKHSVQDSMTENCNAKNRSGRTITAPPVNAVFIAHTLLNVRNMQPLSAFKASQVGAAAADLAEFRLRKFVKPANRAERRRINKMKKSASSSSTLAESVTNIDNPLQEQRVDNASRSSANDNI